MSDVTTKAGDLTIRIDRECCIGSGNCVKVAPKLFRLDDEGLAAFAEGAPDVPREEALEGCSVCPVEALFATDEGGKQLVP